MPTATAGEGTSQRVRRLLADTLELARLRLELFGVEAREDLGTLVALGMQALVAAILLGFGLVFLAVLATLLLWDTHRVLAVGVATAVFWIAGIVLLLNVRYQLRQGLRLFSSTLDELRRDQEELRP